MFLGNSIFHLFLTNLLILTIKCDFVQFDTPTVMIKNVPYKLSINNPNPGQTFPVENFVFSFELLSTVSPRNLLSIADISSTMYTGEEYRGFSIKDFVIKPDTIEMNIEFRREAYGTTFRIRYSSAKTENEKEEFYDKNSDQYIIYEKYVDLILPYEISMQVGPEIRAILPSDRDVVGHVLLPGKNGQISCVATEGLPNSLPKFVNSYDLPGSTVSFVNNDASKLIWKVHLRDHGKQIQCRAGNEFRNVTLNVYHYMTGVTTLPKIDKNVEFGSEIKCIGTDGFPLPKTEWVFIKGPPESDKYFDLQDNNVSLLINSSAPINSNWTFECRGSNLIPSAVRKYLSDPSPEYPLKRMYNFTIVGVLDSNVKSASTGVVVVTIIMVILTISVIATIFTNKDKIQQFISKKRFGRAGQLSKGSQKPSDPGYKYTGIGKGDSHVNGNEKEDAICYNEIVTTVQPKSQNPLGPIHRV